jgi:pyrroline-5-carboxylate reductase
VLPALGAAMRADCLVISVAAGISTGYIERHLGGGRAWRVVRTMPNTPMLVAEGMAAIAPGKHATPADLADARRLFESAASVVEVTEDKLDAVTALSGSGPAYVFYLVEHMIRAGVELGLTPDQARQLATRTAVGACKMLATSQDSPEALRRKVTSPGGTTQAAVTHLEKSGVGPAVVAAIKAADQRSRELGL